MLVRDHTLSANKAHGRKCEAAYENCPCQECYSPAPSTYRLDGGLRCNQWDDHGCPRPLPTPEHVYTSPSRKDGQVCQRCGTRRL